MSDLPALPTDRLDTVFGMDTFSKNVMQKRLPKAVYKSLLQTIEHGEPLDPRSRTSSRPR